MPCSFKWSFSFGLSHQNPAHVSPLSHACHMHCPSRSPTYVACKAKYFEDTINTQP
jgi:hypothetical protein